MLRNSSAELLGAKSMIDLAVATHLEIEAEVRYWEDATVNGVVDTDGTLIPGRSEDLWKVRMSLADGKIEDWPDATTASIHYKICDAGEYWLTDRTGCRLSKWHSYYVPADFLCHGRGRHSDYIIMTIVEGGFIENYVRPSIEDSDWHIIANAS